MQIQGMPLIIVLQVRGIIVTFQVESGDRIELQVKGNEYGMLVEGDYGKLSFQGTRYLGFERQV